MTRTIFEGRLEVTVRDNQNYKKLEKTAKTQCDAHLGLASSLCSKAAQVNGRKFLKASTSNRPWLAHIIHSQGSRVLASDSEMGKTSIYSLKNPQIRMHEMHSQMHGLTTLKQVERIALPFFFADLFYGRDINVGWTAELFRDSAEERC
jgi:hypothetical protein